MAGVVAKLLAAALRVDEDDLEGDADLAILVGAALDAAALKGKGATAITGAATEAAPVDPVFAAIERHRVLWSRVVDMDQETDPCRVHPGPHAYKAAHEEYEAAEEALLTTVPVTKGGARAILEYLIKFDEGCEPDVTGGYFPTLLKSPLSPDGRAPSSA